MKYIVKSIVAGIISSIIVYVIELSAGFLAFFILFSPAPIYYIGLSFGVYYALIAAISALISVFILFDIMFALFFGLLFLFPTIIIIYLALLNREVQINNNIASEGEASQGFSSQRANLQIQWFPISKIIYWASIIIVIGTMLVFFINFPTIEHVKPVIAQIIDFNLTITKTNLPQEQILAIRSFLEENLAGMMAFSWFSSVFASLYVGARAARTRGTLLPEWPNFHWIRLPIWYGFVFATASFISFIMPEAGYYLSPLLSCFAIGLWIVGISIIHMVASQIKAKVPFLVFVYIMMLILMPVNIIIIFLGMADPILKLREKRFDKSN